MAGVSLPVTRPAGRALVVGSAACRAGALGAMHRLGFACVEADDPYAAMVEIAARSASYRSVVLCLNALFREELSVVSAIKRRYGHIEIWLAQSDGRASAMAEAIRLGADGLLAEDGLHRTAMPAAEAESTATASNAVEAPEPEPMRMSGDPLLTADELRALLQDEPTILPAEG